MIQIQTVPLEHLYSVWPVVEPMLKRSVESSMGDSTIDSLKVDILYKMQTLVVAVQDNNIIGAATLKIENYPTQRVVYITSTGGKGIINEEVFGQIETWAKANGASKVRAVARPAQARLYQSKTGLNAVTTILEKTI
jgi:hypothetical protein